jgi:hypothetical protein
MEKTMQERRCDRCGEPFIPRQYNQRFCGGPCSINWHQDERRRAIELLRSTALAGAVSAVPLLGVDISAVPDLGFGRHSDD